MSGIWGKRIELSLFGESHGPAIGITIHGLPSGIKLNLTEISNQMARRRPGQNAWSTPRKEMDSFEIISGFFEGCTTGTPLTAIIRNTDQKSRDYGRLMHVMRPSHGDYPGFVKYAGANDYRGGGHFSGRITAPLVFAGAVAAQILALKGIQAGAVVTSIGKKKAGRIDSMNFDIQDLSALRKEGHPVLQQPDWCKFEEEIRIARENQDSVGGTVQCVVMGVPAGVGEPFFHSLESHLASLLFSIPAVKGVEFGTGFDLASMRGSRANDTYYYKEGEVATRSNHNGGILGGISNGMTIDFTVAIKPTPSIGKEQKTVDIETEEDTTLSIKGRHDPCIVPRAVPVIEAAATLAVLDMMMWGQIWN
ncbi:chorismate synthase [Clostridia bacterium]|nr:chorismate synthase [Clostridia bacterium]